MILFDKPSMYNHIISGFLFLVAFLVVLFNNEKIANLDITYKLILLLLFTLTFIGHGIFHLLLEVYYGYNPLITYNLI